MACGECEGCTMDMPRTETTEFCNHELHVTVHQPRGVSLSDFVRVCGTLGIDAVAMRFVGPLDGAEWMTRESFHGPDRSARLALALTGSTLASLGFDPIRVKIEAAPWHPLAPARASDARPAGSYYESHMGLWLHDEEVERALAAAHPLSVYLSCSLRKGPRADGRLRYSVTLRSVSAGRYEQETAASLLRDSLRARGLDADSKVRTEWTWLDAAMDPTMPGGPPQL